LGETSCCLPYPLYRSIYASSQAFDVPASQVAKKGRIHSERAQPGTDKGVAMSLNESMGDGTEASLDCRGLKCPMPIVKIAQTARGMQSGQILTVVASDPAFPADLRAWVEMTGNELLELVDNEPLLARIKMK